MSRPTSPQKGTALLAVLWLTAALSAIAFTVADSVRAETERAISYQESVRAYYLARGAVERTLYLLRNPDDFGGASPAERFVNRRRLYWQDVTGDTIVELLSERGKIPLRQISPVLLGQLLELMGEPPAAAAAIVQQAFSNAPVLNSNGQPTFRLAPASMENVEELLLIPGITSEMVYGRYLRQADGSLVNVGGLADFFTPHRTSLDGLDALSVHPTLLAALGTPFPAAQAMAAARASVLDGNAAIALMNRIPSAAGLRNDLGDVFQIRATSRPRLPNGQLSATRRSVSLLVKYTPPNPRYLWISPWTHLRWYDQTFSELGASDAVWLTTPPPAAKRT
jgi:general secretion pathway protein K